MFCPAPNWASNTAISTGAVRICLIRGTPIRFNNEIVMAETMQGLASHVFGAIRTSLSVKFRSVFGRDDIDRDLVLVPYRIPIHNSKEEELSFHLLLRRNRTEKSDTEVVTATFDMLVSICKTAMGLELTDSAILNIGFMDLEVVTSEFTVQENPYLNKYLTDTINQVSVITKLAQATLWQDIDDLFYLNNQKVIPFIRFIIVLRGGLSKPTVTLNFYRDKLLHSDSMVIFWMGACRDIKRDLLIEFLNRDTLRRSVIIKYADVPGMEEFGLCWSDSQQTNLVCSSFSSRFRI